MVSPTSRRLALLAATWLLSSVAAFGWGEQGHRIVALAAQEHLSANATKRFGFLFGRNAKLVNLATWANGIMENRPETEAWHSITIPEGATEVDLARDCPIGDCVTVKLRDCVGIVRLGIKPRDETRDAFRMLVNLAADLHQPLLSGYPPSLSKDDSVVSIRGKQMTLMEAFERGLIEHLGSEQEVLQRVRRRILAADKDAWSEGSLRAWTWENHQFATGKVYPLVGDNEKTVLNGAALESASDLVIERLAKAAVRLAAMLDVVWPGT